MTLIVNTIRMLSSIPFAFALVSAADPTPASAGTTAWAISKSEWSAQDEIKFSEFVRIIGESKCRNLNECLRLENSPYRLPLNDTNFYYSDCADLPYALRAYFAYRNELPFGYVQLVKADASKDPQLNSSIFDLFKPKPKADTRYNRSGNLVVKRWNASDLTTTSKSFQQILREMNLSIGSSMYRFHPSQEFQLDQLGRPLFFDLYPIAIRRESLKPGTVIYDPNGHVAVVYAIEDDGRIRFIDAHPDGSITRGIYGEKFARSHPNMGAGFKNWRPIRLTTNPKSQAIQLETVTNALIPDYSLEQYVGNSPNEKMTDDDWKAGSFTFNDIKLSYYDFVRSRLSIGDLRFEPLRELKNGMEAICSDLIDRVSAVEEAFRQEKGMVAFKTHPEALPYNIYGTDGEWENFSTPSRDARLKTSFLELKRNIHRFVEMYEAGSPRIVYSGSDLLRDLLTVYDRVASNCQIRYLSTPSSRANGAFPDTIQRRETITLSYEDIVSRLFSLSFDPYHCAELRWGAPLDSQEMNNCRDDDTKRQWYLAQQGLRNQLERTYGVDMSATLDDLQSGRSKLGVKTAPNVDLRNWLLQRRQR